MAANPAPLVLLAGGGSGGHVFPALAVAGELSRRGWRVALTGSPTGMEARLAPERGVPFHPLPARPVLGRGPLAKAAALVTLARSAVAARGLVRRLGALAVVGTGGYASVPAVLGARLARRPVLLVEPNARAGAANRHLSRFAQGAAVAFEVTRTQLACPAEVTGVPVRPEFFGGDGLPEGPLRMLVLGGSQGAVELNRRLPPALAALGHRVPGLSIVHQCGAAHEEATRRAYAEAGVEARVVPFIGDVAGALAGCHLVVSRAGAIACAEICAAGRPSLLVPLAIAGGHQRDNAGALAEAGAALTAEGEALAPEPLATTLAALLGDRRRLEGMARAARSLARPGAVAAIADRVEALAAGPSAEARPAQGGAAP